MRRARIAIQLGALVFFLILIFFNTYPAAYRQPVSIFMRLDPYSGILSTIASRTLVVELLPALLILLSAVIAGRVFCGYVCPLGTTLDLMRKVLRLKSSCSKVYRIRLAKYYLLLGTVVAALVGINMSAYLDPIVIAERSGIFIFRQTVFIVLALSRAHLPVEIGFESEVSRYYELLPVFLILISVVLLLEIVSPRFWCRYLCPLGALLSLVGSKALFTRKVSDQCDRCGLCRSKCVFGAVGDDPSKVRLGECTLCHRCVTECRREAIEFSWGRADFEGVSLSRRMLVASIGAGIGYALIAPRIRSRRAVLRPPGARSEDEFLKLCTRCGACIGVCVTGGLQPSLLEAGLEGIWSPVLKPRLGGCEAECNLCGKVCNTQAIRYLPLDEKKKIKIGLAVINRRRCIGWKRGKICLICHEICPYGAISFSFGYGRGGNRPMVIESKCTGCGLCEWKCPVEPSAIKVLPR